MKTLLLMLGVVAFVYLDSGYSLKCEQCNLPNCDFLPDVWCPKGLDQCYKRWNETTKVFERGCTANCIEDEQTRCCKTNGCNF
ncbi:three-finger toxin 3 [Protobothrops mucrosquamatus]|uniref:three-finger toxin 3 n=1 Tax=Protobothrops mucrosquamatus TaxID=103944 RepID=UPI000775A932|nr:three-finger toxin 3 [Protobothrops mucrosquamatus]